MPPRKSWRRRRDQGIVFSVIKGPKYANIDYLDFLRRELDKVFAELPRRPTSLCAERINGPQNGNRGCC